MSLPSLRIVIAKPDPGMVGGFERVVQRVSGWLRSRGHDVRVVSVRTDLQPSDVLPQVPSKALERAAPEFLAHLTLLSAFRRLNLRDADVVISTQPPSQAAQHRRHLALFYHHDRIFYDLADLVAESGYVPDAELHRELSTLVRAADKPGMDAVTQFVVPSAAVKERLALYNGVRRVLPFHAGLGTGGRVGASANGRDDGHVLCVSRHEFPKRTELFVQAAHLMPELSAVCVGAGSRLAFVQRIDRHLDRNSSIDPLKLWCRQPSGALPLPSRQGRGHVRFVTHAPTAELDRLYRYARCVVAPAFEEDYGLTAIEAMSWGVPLVVCEDGGSLAELVRETGAGTVVPPQPQAIADAVRALTDDRELAERRRASGLEAATRRFTWPKAFEQLDAALERVMAGAP